MRNAQEVKDKFLKICSDYRIQEVYVNFDNPFTEPHEKWGEEMWVVPAIDNHGSTGLSSLLCLFAPAMNSEDESEIIEVGLECHAVRKDSSLTRDEIIADASFKLIYTKERGIV